MKQHSFAILFVYMLKHYSKKEDYEEVGWDENGISKSVVLKQLGLEEVDKVLKEKVR